MDLTERERGFVDFLLEHSLLPATLVQQACRVSVQTRTPLVHSIIKLGFMPELRVADVLADFEQLPRLAQSLRLADSLTPLSIQFLRQHAIAPLEQTATEVTVALADPLNDTAVRGVQFATSKAVKVYVATLTEIQSALEAVQPEPDDSQQGDTTARNDDMAALRDLASDAPAIRLVQRLITAAVDSRASDIHIEPVDSALRVRFRLDGVLKDMEELPIGFAGRVVSRIKVMAHLDIAERRLPQDGRLNVTVNGKAIDFRVATAPTLHGESVVLRILDRQEVELDFRRLGFDAEAETVMRSALQKPHGIILATGPTGSGKTTTLYTALKELNQPDRKILTVEDPIEYMLSGVNQTQVKPQIGYTFAAALRAFLRQDPDVLMVGEIRDKETAEVAIQASLTGHLLLSTLHTNSAAAAVTRLLDMGVDDFLLTSTLSLLIGQRLVRRLCQHCRAPYAPEPGLRDRLLGGRPPSAAALQLFRAVGCAQCGGVGYSGRAGILELLEICEPVRRAVLAKADAGTIEKIAVERGMRTMFQHGLMLAARGETSLEEILRVTQSGD